MSTKNNKAKNVIKEIDAEVLYQRLGDRWFAFSLIGDEVFMSPVTDEIIQRNQGAESICGTEP